MNDYRILLVEAWKNNFVFHNMENIDFFKLMEIILDRHISKKEAREKAIQYSEEHKTGKSVVMAVAGATDSNIDYHAFEKGDGRMCTLFDEIAEEGRAEEIIDSGFEFGLSEEDILSRLQRKLGVSLQRAQEYFNMYRKQTV